MNVSHQKNVAPKPRTKVVKVKGQKIKIQVGGPSVSVPWIDRHISAETRRSLMAELHRYYQRTVIGSGAAYDPMTALHALELEHRRALTHVVEDHYAELLKRVVEKVEDHDGSAITVIDLDLHLETHTPATSAVVVDDRDYAVTVNGVVALTGHIHFSTAPGRMYRLKLSTRFIGHAFWQQPRHIMEV